MLTDALIPLLPFAAFVILGLSELSGPGLQNRAQLVDRVGRHLELGFTEQIINCQGPDHAGIARAAAEALPELRSALVR